MLKNKYQFIKGTKYKNEPLVTVPTVGNKWGSLSNTLIFYQWRWFDISTTRVALLIGFGQKTLLCFRESLRSLTQIYAFVPNYCFYIKSTFSGSYKRGKIVTGSEHTKNTSMKKIFLGVLNVLRHDTTRNGPFPSSGAPYSVPILCDPLFPVINLTLKSWIQ